MGCTVVWEKEGVRVLGPERLRPVDLEMNDMPDMVPTLAVLAAFAPGTTRIRNVAHLRIKESDRIRAVAEELAKLAVPVDELPDGLVISGGGVKGAVVEAHDDHRIAMAFAVAGLKVPGISIAGAETVSKSFPKFWEVFRKLSHG
jgi:3-phosphoshikimate 1-carboxyvinyltransferase